MTGKARTWLAVGVAGSLLLGAALLARLVWAQFEGPIQATRIDLARPQAYIASSALARLPRDLVKAPLLRELLTEDFAFYYEEHEDRLGLRGAIKRIAYEHDTTLSDRLLAAALDEPAEIAAWADAKGAPRLWALAMTRNTVARALQGLGALAAGDSQLSVIGKLTLNGAEVTAYALNLNPRRTLALLVQGQRVLVLSDPGLLFDARRQPDAAAQAVVAALLSTDVQAQGVWRRHLGLAPVAPAPASGTTAASPAAAAATPPGSGDAGHTLVASARLLSFGYQAYFPSIEALRLDVGAAGTSLRLQLRLTGDTAWAGVARPAVAAAAARQGKVPTPGGQTTAAPAPTAAPSPATPTPDRALWAAVPANPATCSLLPADWNELKALAASARAPAASPADQAAWSALAEQLDGPAALCWYARSQLHTPLLVARLRDGAPLEPSTAALASLARWLAPAGSTETRPAARPGPAGAPAVATRWQREVKAPWGPLGRDEATRYRPTLALQGRVITWSPDDALVELALDTQARRYPGVAEALPPVTATATATASAAPTLLVIDPRQLADLAIRETVQVLPTSQELFRQAAQRHLAPRLVALKKLAPVRAVAQGRPDAQGWVAIDWLPLAGAAGAATPPGAPR